MDHIERMAATNERKAQGSGHEPASPGRAGRAAQTQQRQNEERREGQRVVHVVAFAEMRLEGRRGHEHQAAD